MNQNKPSSDACKLYRASNMRARNAIRRLTRYLKKAEKLGWAVEKVEELKARIKYLQNTPHVLRKRKA